MDNRLILGNSLICHDNLSLYGGSIRVTLSRLQGLPHEVSHPRPRRRRHCCDGRQRPGRELVRRRRCGGQRRPGPGYFYEPTLVADLSDGSRLVDEEPFGPILPVIRYSDIDEVIARANRSPYGLGGSVWSADPARAAELGLRLECGSVWINGHGAIQPDAPFGGVKQSGIGVEFGRYGLEEYTALQTLKILKR